MSSQCVIDERGQYRVTVYQQTNSNQQQENVIANLMPIVLLTPRLQGRMDSNYWRRVTV